MATSLGTPLKRVEPNLFEIYFCAIIFCCLYVCIYVLLCGFLEWRDKVPYPDLRETIR
jgi:hypothetical protein